MLLIILLLQGIWLETQAQTTVSTSSELINALVSATGSNEILLLNNIDLGRLSIGNLGKTSITINGQGYGISGSGSYVLNIQNGKSLILQNIGSYDDNGNIQNSFSFNSTSPVITNNGILSIDNVIFSDNTITNYNYPVIYNSYNGVITQLNADFIGNKAYSFSEARGGAIYNAGTIENITGNFINNSAYFGGAIYNEGASLVIANSNFINNTATSSGSAIYNLGGLEIVNSSFINNEGDAISTRDLSIKADNGTTIFTGNGSAIYMQSGDNKTDLTAINNGEIIIDDDINGFDIFYINIDGDSSSNIQLNGSIGARGVVTLNNTNLSFGTNTFDYWTSLNVESGNVDLNNELIENYNIYNLTSSINADYSIDVDLTGETAVSDKIITSNNPNFYTGSSGVIKIDDINIIGDKKDFTVQVLETAPNPGMLGRVETELSLSENLLNKYNTTETETLVTSDDIKSDVNWQDKFYTYEQEKKTTSSIGLTTTNTINDSIEYKLETSYGEKKATGNLGDTLTLINQYQTSDERNFNFDTSGDVYEVSSDLGTTSEGTLNINGALAPVPDGNNEHSTINGNNHSLFRLDNETTLNMNNIKITGANNVVTGTNKDAVVNINNSEISNNTEGITTAGSVNISGNSIIENNGSGITVTSDSSVITLDAADAEITLRDRLTGVAGARLNINRGMVNFELKISALDVMMEQANVNVASDDLFDGNNMTVNSASNLNMANNAVGTMHLNNFTLNDNLNMSVDVDLANKSMDRITADSYNLGDNNVNVSNMNLLTSTDRYKTDILFADAGLRNNVTTSISEVAYSPIYKYNVAYEKDTGNFTFTRPGVVPPTPDNPNPVPDNSYNSYNPAVMASPVASQLGGYMAMLDTYNNAFTHMDMYMLKPSTIRLAEQKENQYAITDTTGLSYKSNEMNSKGIWVKPFAAYDSVGLKNGPKVDNFSYGTFIGGDTEMFKTKGGFYGVVSPYIAYQGSHQSYAGNSIYQNGGTLGGTATFYKENFFTGLTAGVGMNVADASTMYGSENFPMLMAGVANKTGYNFEFKDGRFIIQPNLMLSYTFVNAFDYTNGAGVKINSDPLHALQITPNVKFIMNTKNGWQPYAAFGMHWNIMDETNVTANTAYLPELSVKPYFSYGLGIQRVFGERFTAYGQIMLRNGGRNGIAATFGGRYLFGHETKTDEETEEI